MFGMQLKQSRLFVSVELGVFCDIIKGWFPIFSPRSLHHIRQAKQLKGRFFAFRTAQRLDGNKPGWLGHELMTNKNYFRICVSIKHRCGAASLTQNNHTVSLFSFFARFVWHLIKIHPCQTFGQICSKGPSRWIHSVTRRKKNICKGVDFQKAATVYFCLRIPGPGCRAELCLSVWGGSRVRMGEDGRVIYPWPQIDVWRRDKHPSIKWNSPLPPRAAVETCWGRDGVRSQRWQ